MKRKPITPILVTLGSVAITAIIFAQGPPPGGRTHTETKAKPLKLYPANRDAPGTNKVKIEVKDEFRVITSNNIPKHLVGKFPNEGNPNEISAQDVEIRLPLKPEAREQSAPARSSVGILLNGVYLEPGTAEFWGAQGSVWNYEALGGAIDLGLDANHAHVQPTGKYHYHGKPTGYLKDIELSPQKHSPLIGWAFDGFPIYALYGYEDPKDPNSKIVEMTSSFKLKSGNRPDNITSPGGKYDGAFVQDYEYVKGSGKLDECNGRFTITPEFPDGTYAYFLTNQWPVIYRNFRGEPAVRQHEGPGGGPGGGPGPGPGGPRRGPPPGRPGPPQGGPPPR
jgi:YHYH protein